MIEDQSGAQEDFVVLYGTQTNTSQLAAEEIGRESLKRKLKAKIMSFDEFPIIQLPQTKRVVFVIATTGEGEAPQTMLNAWQFLLRKDLPPNSLKNLHFSVFGLGDSSYALFNAMAKKLTQRLLDLGATLFHKVGLGDYQHDFGYEGEFDPWMEALWPNLKHLLPPVHPMLLEVSQDQNTILDPVYKVEIVDMNSQKPIESTLRFLPKPLGAIQSQEVSFAQIIENKKLTKEGHFQDTRKICLQFESQGDYKPGDVLMIQPQNDETQVNELIERIGLKPNTLLKIDLRPENFGQTSISSLIKFPQDPQTKEIIPISAFELFSSWLNIMEPPSRNFCKIMGSFLANSQNAAIPQEELKMKSEKLLHFSSKSSDGKSDYFGYAVRERRSILEIFRDFGVTTEVPLEYMIQGIGKLRPREFSISSKMRRNESLIQADLTMAVTEFTTKFDRKIKGICSSYLASQQTNDQLVTRVPVWLKQGTMTFFRDRPLIFVGPGTGIAAFRSAIQELALTGQTLVLIFGCRSEQDDFYYADEWQQLKDDPRSNFDLITAFSRENPSEGKTYVQHKIRAYGEKLAKLIIEQNAAIYVSGRAKFMPKSVEKAFTEIIQTTFEGSGEEKEEKAKKFIAQMKKDRKYQQEVW